MSDTFECGHTMDDIVGGVCAGCMAADDARLRELEAEVQRLRRNGTWAMNERDSALDAMEASDDENERLRNALRKIVDLSLPYRDSANRAREIARKALEL